MTIEMIVDELKNEGYEVQITDVVKNGVTMHGITMGNGNIRPTICVDEFLNSDEELEDVVDVIKYRYGKAMEKDIELDTNNIMSWNNAKAHLQLCLQKQGNENIVKRSFLDLEQYVRVIVNTNEDAVGSFKVTPEHLKHFGVSEDVLFSAAWDCTKPTLVEVDMVKIMAEMMGETEEEIIAMLGDAPKQIVISNKSKINGSIAMCDTWLLKKIANKYKANLVILPSSIHEVIVMPIDCGTSRSDLDAMVKNVNETQVAPEEVLSNHAYIFNRDTMEITW